MSMIANDLASGPGNASQIYYRWSVMRDFLGRHGELGPGLGHPRLCRDAKKDVDARPEGRA